MYDEDDHQESRTGRTCSVCLTWMLPPWTRRGLRTIKTIPNINNIASLGGNVGEYIQDRRIIPTSSLTHVEEDRGHHCTIDPLVAQGAFFRDVSGWESHSHCGTHPWEDHHPPKVIARRQSFSREDWFEYWSAEHHGRVL